MWKPKHSTGDKSWTFFNVIKRVQPPPPSIVREKHNWKKSTFAGDCLSPRTPRRPTTRWYSLTTTFTCAATCCSRWGIECDCPNQQIWASISVEMKKKEYNPISTFLPRSLLPGNQQIQHILVRGQIRQNVIKQIRSIFDVWHSQHRLD